MNNDKPRGARAYLLAARPKTLAAALTPVIMASALAYADDTFRARPALLCALFAALMQVASNLLNDLLDYRRGSDTVGLRLGPERACAGGWIDPRRMACAVAVVAAAAALTGLAMLKGVYMRMPYGGWELVAIGLICMVFAVLYTTTLAGRGLGDVAVVVFFGLVPVCGTYYVQAAGLTTDVVWTALACGLAVDALLVVNNYRDRDQDALAGKRTLIVRLGPTLGRRLYLYVGLLAALCCLPVWVSRQLSSLSLLYAVGGYVYLHLSTYRRLCAIDHGAELNTLLGRTARNILFFGLLMAVALMSE